MGGKQSSFSEPAQPTPKPRKQKRTAEIAEPKPASLNRQVEATETPAKTVLKPAEPPIDVVEFRQESQRGASQTHARSESAKADEPHPPEVTTVQDLGPYATETRAHEQVDMVNVSALLTGRSADALRLFHVYDSNQDGRLSPAELHKGLQSLGLKMQADMFSQFVECNFLYADRDLDGHLSLMEWTQLFKLMSEVAKKFTRYDEDKDGMIGKADFHRIVSDLDLKLTPTMLRQYVDVNFKFVDRGLQGRLTFGQFLACYANFLYSYEISQGIRRRRLAHQQSVRVNADHVKSVSKTLASAQASLDDHAGNDVLASLT